MQKESTYLYLDLAGYFAPAEAIDYYLGKHHGLSLQHALSRLEQDDFSLPPLLSIFSALFNPIPQPQTHRLAVDPQAVAKLVHNDGVRILLGGLSRVVGRMGSQCSLAQQLSLKVLMNVIYTCVDYLEHNPSNPASSAELNQLYVDLQVDDTLMRMVTLSLEHHFIPIRKLTMLYSRVLANLFHHPSPTPTHPNPTPPSVLHPARLYSDSDAGSLPHSNLLRVGELQKYKQQHPPPTGPVPNDKLSPVQRFYRKHNTGECPLAQSIVVGLLRSLLTICNCQAHKKFQTVRGGGVDSFREWQLSYRYLIENRELESCLPQWLVARIRSYQAFDQGSDSDTWGEFYAHKIYTTSAITVFFLLMLLALRNNMRIQYSYFLQLISDANGILVFLKFLTDKFAGLDAVSEWTVFTRSEDAPVGFREKTMLTIYAVLLMLYTSCNNYPEKIRSYLFEYNSYLIIKKIPSLFLPKSEDNALPSREEIDSLEEGRSGILRKLTELCYDLLKIQIPFFSKKMKENTANMRMIIDIYCRYPPQPPPQIYSPLQKLLLKSKSPLLKQEKFITSVQEMKTINNDYNNLYYWTNDFLQEQPSKPVLNDNLDTLIDPQLWLQENLWKYYD